MKRTALFLILVLMLSGCAKRAAAQGTSSPTIPAIVEGIVVDNPLRIESTDDQPATYSLIIDVNGVEGSYPVDPETWVKAWTGDHVRLQCDPLPCVMEK